MKITVLAIGKKHDPKLRAAIEEYTKRLQHYAPVSWGLVEAKITSSMSENEIKSVESQALLSKISGTDTVVLLDESGTQLNSPIFAERLQNYMNQSVKNLVFIIGGAYGVTDEVKHRAAFTWSLSPLVFPHRLVRLILIEQLYRAHTIIAGEKYHHA